MTRNQWMVVFDRNHLGGGRLAIQFSLVRARHCGGTA